MGARKVAQEIEKCFKQVALGVDAFDSQYEKYEQSTNASQRDKLVENIKKECKKLQRLRDQIKTWAAGNEVKDKAPLLERRELIETKMEAFKAIEKEMKTKAFSKEGLNAQSKLDPREREKEDMERFIGEQVEELGRQIEAIEAEIDVLQAQAKKSKKGDNTKTERVQELEHKVERHKWHQNKLELLMRNLANDDVEPEQIKNAEESIKDYVDNNAEVDFYEDEGLYDEFNLEEGEARFGVLADIDRTSSHEGQSLPEEGAEGEAKGKSKSAPEPTPPAGARRPSQHIKSPLPTLATLHTAPAISTTSATSSMKPAPPPAKPSGETLKYASAAAAAAAANDTSGIGIAPLPPPPGKTQTSAPAQSKPATSPAAAASTPGTATETKSIPATLATDKAPATTAAVKSPVPSHSSIGTPSPAVSSAQLAQASAREEVPPLPHTSPVAPTSHIAATKADEAEGQNHDRDVEQDTRSMDGQEAPHEQTNGVDHSAADDTESVWHLPASLQELVDCFEACQNANMPAGQPQHQHQLAASYASRPDTFDTEKPRHYRPQNPSLSTPAHYPQEPLPIFDDPRLYSKIDTDALFYSFYYRQGTYQQYLAAKALKQQSWRFHKQYQTWFQRHEEPKSITEDYEQGTYRFFDYESTWMNRRKQDFKFAYKFLEDDL